MRHPFVRLAVVLAIGIALLSTAPSAAPQASPGRRATPTNVTAITAAEFFAPARVWTASLTMLANQTSTAAYSDWSPIFIRFRGLKAQL